MVFGERFFGVQCPIGKVPRTAADAKHVVVAQISSDFADDHGNGIGAEFDAHLGIEIVDCLDKSDTADLKEIVRVAVSPCESLNDAEHKSEISVNQLGAGFFISLFYFCLKGRFFLRLSAFSALKY